LRFHRSDASNFNSAILGAGAVEKMGAGSLTVGGKFSHTGTTTISAGSLVAGAAQVMSTTSYTTVSAGATLDLNGLSQTLGSLAGSGTVQTGSVAQAVLSVGDANHTTFSGAILGSGNLTKNGAGILTLSGANSYTGETRITMGGLTLSGADRLSNQTALSVANGATFTLGGVAQRIGSLAGAGSVVLGAGTLSTGTNNVSTQFSGVISGTGGVAKAGTGEWTLTGANTYTGATTLNGGMLTLNGSLAISAMTVNTGTTLAGSGSTAGAVTVQSGGTLSPGQRLGNQSLPGLLTISNSLSLLAGSTLVMDLDPNGNNLTDDQILGPTSVNLAGNLVVNGLSSFASLTGGSWRLINSGAVPTGSFSSVTLPSVTAVTNATSAFSVVTNESPVASQFPVTLRLASLSAASPQPHSLSLAGADDTGVSNRDGLTRNTSALTVGGVAQPGKKVWLFNDLNNNGQMDDGEVLATNITATATYGVFTHDIELGAGTHRIMAVQVESDGSRSPVSQALLITVDLEATLSPGVATLVNDSQQTSDTGLLGSDLITNNPFPTFRFQLPTAASNVSAAYAASAGMTFELRRLSLVEATRILTTEDITRGYIDIVPDAAIGQGSYFQQWRGVITDRAGNVSSTDTVWSIPLLRVDTTAPGIPYGNPSAAGTALELLTNSDTGRSSTDTAIALNTGFSVRGISSTDTRLIGLRLYNPNGTSTDLGTLSFSDTTHWTYTYTGAALADGNYALRARAMDLAGNWSAESAALNFSIDTTPPAALAAPSLTPASDSGLSSTDGVTNLTSSLVVSGVAAPSAQVRLLDYGVSASNTGLNSLGVPAQGNLIATATANAQGVYTFSNLDLAPGIHHLRVIQNDVAGNWSAPGTALRANIDTQPPVTPTVFFSDTSSRTPTLSGTYDASNTEQLVVRINNLVYGVTAGTSVNIDGTATITVAGLVLNAASGTWSLAIPRERELSASLAGTLYTVTVMATDLAGNRVISNSRDQLRLSSAEIGGAGIPISTPVNMLAYASQIGQLYSFSVTGRAQLNGSLQGSDLYALNTNLNIAAVHAGMVAVGETKTVSVMIMPSGSSPASVRNGVSSDAMSGVGFRFVRSELTPLGISLAAAGDSATVGDNITRQLAPVLRIALPSSLQAGDTVRLGLGTTEVLRHTLSAADLVNRGSSGSPAYWVDLQAHTLFNGNNTVYNTANDNAITAQVLRVQNGAFQASASVTLQTLLVDNVASPAPYSTSLARGDDLGNPLVPQHQTDNRLPRGNQFNLTGWVHANYGTVSVEVWAGTRLLGSTGVTADSRWSFFLPATAQPLADGVHNITVIAIDAAGNRSTPSTALALTIDTAIGKPGNLAIHSSFDSGIKGDNITSRALDSALLITGKADPSLPIHPYWDGSNYTFNNSLRVFDDANNNGILDAGEELAIYNSAGYQWSDWRGNFSIYIDPKQLAEGSHRLRVVQMDAAGNLSVASDALTLHIDRAPQAPLGVFLAPGQDDGLSSSRQRDPERPSHRARAGWPRTLESATASRSTTALPPSAPTCWAPRA
jgi:autotransporter-associated beta strand protein